MWSQSLVLFALVAAAAASPISNAATPTCGQVKKNPVAAAASFIANMTGEDVLGGSQAKDGSWPWTVSICVKDWFGTCNFHAAGAIISDRWVVTTYSGTDQAAKSSSYYVRAGSTNKGSDGQYVQVSDIWHLNDVSTVSHYDDIALVKLGSSLQFNSDVQPICLPQSDAGMVNTGSHAWFTGWGHSSDSAFATQETYLRQANLPFIDGGVCANKYAHYYSDVQLCAGGEGKTTCNYDQGGPLMQQKDGTWYLYGIAATKDYTTGSSCTTATIFTRASQFCGFFQGTAGVSCI